MKTKLFAACLCMLMLTGCKLTGVQPSSSPSPTPSAVTSTVAPDVLTADEKLAEPVLDTDKSAAGEGWTAVQSTEFDIDGDGQEDEITLYTSAQQESGIFLWDDSNGWCLEIKTAKERYYPLFQENSVHGNVYFSVGEQQLSGETIPVVYMQLQSGTNLELVQFTYEHDGVIRRTLYNAAEQTGEALNMFYYSAPVY